MSKREHELQENIELAGELVVVGGLYTNYKNLDNIYEAQKLTIMESDESVAITYQALYGLKITFTRPLYEWIEQVEFEGELVPRFRKYSF